MAQVENKIGSFGNCMALFNYLSNRLEPWFLVDSALILLDPFGSMLLSMYIQIFLTPGPSRFCNTQLPVG